MGLTKIAITRPVFILMMMLVAILLGTMSMKSMRVEQNPEVNFGVLSITTVYPGAGPEEISNLVSKKIEESVSGVNGLREVTSTSQDGFSVVSAQFEIGTDMNEALNDTRAKIDGVVNQLPRDVQKPIINKFDTASQPVLFLSLNSKTLNPQQLRDLADDKLSDRFARIPGVASVSVNGGDKREIQIQVKKDKLLSYGIGINDVLNSIRNSTLNVPSGRFQAGTKEYSVRVFGEFKKVDEIKDMNIRVSDPKNPGQGRVVPLIAVADVIDGVAEKTQRDRLNGQDAISMTIQKAREGNAVEISKAARDPKTGIIQGIKKDFGVDVIVTLDQATTIQESLNDLKLTLFLGILLVTGIVYLFLHNLRGTIIVAIAIPVCIFATFIVMKALGFTINNLSMLALSLAIGVLVDDAIVVLENIYRHLQMGEDPVSAAINGRSEIGLAAIAITLADVVVFLPIGFMGGIVGQFFKPLGIGFAVTTLLSLFVSFTVTPMLASRWYRSGEDWEHPTGKFARWFEGTFKKIERRYARVLEWALHHRWFVFTSGFVVLISVFIMIGGSFSKSAPDAVMMAMRPLVFCIVIGVIVTVVNIFRGYAKPKFILYGALFGLVFPAMALVGFGYASWKKEPIFKFSFFPPSDGGSVNVTLELPPGSNLDATQKVVEGVEKIVSRHPDVKYVRSAVGSAGGSGGFTTGASGTNYATITVTLNDKDALLDHMTFAKHEGKMRTVSAQDVSADLLERIGRIPGVNVKVSAGDGFGFGSPIQMSFRGDDHLLILATAEKIRDGLKTGVVKGVINPDLSVKPGKPELKIVPDRTRLADAGISVSDVGNSMRVLYEGNDDTKFRVFGKEYPIRVMMNLEDRNNAALLDQVPVSFNQGKPIYVNGVADVNKGRSVSKIDRRNREEEVVVSADLLPGFAAGSVQQQINDWIKKEGLVPNGVTQKELGQADVQQREMGYLLSALGLGLILVYMLLASLYDNLLYPFIIQLAQPQAMVGALLALIVTDKTLNLVGFIGIIALVGLVGKNAILVVDYTNTLRARGKDRHDALVEAGPTRLRPIMMTTMALILGMLPVALAIGRGSEFRETIGITIIGGILVSTMLTLVVIPCSYTIFDDISISIGRRIGGNRKPVSVELTGQPEPEPVKVA